ncbi:MAG: uroporphyrinogen decarboxylase family protein [bacterium]
MQQLPCGERFIRCLLGEEIDRVPFGVNLGWWPWGDAMGNFVRESGIDDLDLNKYFGYDMSFASPQIHAGFFPGFEYELIEETEDFITARDWYGIVKRNFKDLHSMPLFIEHPVKEPEDWEEIKEKRLNPNTPGRIFEDWDAFRARIRETGEAVQVGSFPYGVFGTPRDFMGSEELLMAFYTEPEMVRDMMETITTLWINNWEQVAREVQIDHIHIWEDMSGCQGSLLSPAMVEEFMMPQYDRIADFAQANGVRIVSVDTDGDCSELVPIMMNHGINMFFPFETQASNDIIYFRDKYPTLGIMCGLDKRALAADKAAVDKEIEKCATMISRGRYIPGFDHLIPPDAKWENFKYAAEQIKALCYR